MVQNLLSNKSVPKSKEEFGRLLMDQIYVYLKQQKNISERLIYEIAE